MLAGVHDFEISPRRLLLDQLVEVPCGLRREERTIGELLVWLASLELLITFLVLLYLAHFLALMPGSTFVLDHVDSSHDFGVFALSSLARSHGAGS